MIRQGKGARGLLLLDVLVRLRPDSPQVWAARGNGYWGAEEIALALECMEHSARLAPEDETVQEDLRLLRAENYDRQHETKVGICPDITAAGIPEGPFLGQKDPGAAPAVFAPGIVSRADSNEFACTWSPDGAQFWYSARPPGGQNRIMVSHRRERGWTVPEPASFGGAFPNNEPHVGADGQKLYFGSRRPLPDGTPSGHFHTWVARKQDAGWGEPAYFGPGMFVSTTQRGEVYTTDITGFAGGGLVVYEPDGAGGFGAPRQVFREPLPGGRRRSHACVDRTGRFLIYNSGGGEEGLGGDDLYLVWRRPDGSWGRPRHLGAQINSPGHDYGASLSPDGCWMFYGRHQDIWWVNLKTYLEAHPELGPDA